VAYDHGGTDPTVTDVDVVLGFMNPRFFLGGRARLNAGAAFDVLAERVATPLDLEPREGAAAIYRLVNSHIYDLLHRMTIQRGLDPRLFALFSVGGTAGMHLPAVAFELGVPTVVVPYTASVQSAFGLVASDVVHEELVTRPLEAPGEPDVIEGIFSQLSERVLRQLREEGFAPEKTQITRSIDMRYRRQVHVVTAPVLSGGPITESSLAAAIDLFESLYSEKYGPESTYREAGVEFVTFRVRGSGRVQSVDPVRWSHNGRDAANALVESVEAYLPSEEKSVTVPGFDFDLLSVGTQIDGPALIWSPITTVVLNAGAVARLDSYRNLVISPILELAT
jgi:N-methylhydantoinase A